MNKQFWSLVIILLGLSCLAGASFAKDPDIRHSLIEQGIALEAAGLTAFQHDNNTPKIS
jgi:hypothetical protein